MSEVIDPADVRVGDQVEVEADDGSWLVRGEVIETWREEALDYWWFSFRARGKSTFTKEVRDATVRLVRRAEPEPDPEQVEVLAALLHDEKPASRLEFPAGWRDYARNLIREGVTVRKET